MILTKKQTTALDYWEDKATNEILFGGGAGGGKSILGCYALVKSAIKYDQTRWLMGRAKLKTLKETTLNSFLSVCSIQGLKVNTDYRINNQSNIITMRNGSEILMKDLFYYPSDPNFDELGSLEITGAFIDECNQITEKAWNIVRSRIRYKLDDNGIIPKQMGTCNPSKQFVYSRFYKPHVEGKLPADRKFIQALVGDNPNISQHYVRNLESLDPVSRARLLNGNWEYDNDPSQLIDYDKIVDLFVNNHVAKGKRYISADIARLGDDKTKIRVWDGLRSIKKVTIDRGPVTEVASLIRMLQSEYSVPNSNTIVDEDGVGGGVVDILQCKGFINGSRPVEVKGSIQNYANLRSQCYFKLADYVNDNKIFLSDENLRERECIIEDLEQVRQRDIDGDGKLAIVKKEDIKKNIGRSPDEADCLMMRMWFELNVEGEGMSDLNGVFF